MTADGWAMLYVACGFAVWVGVAILVSGFIYVRHPDRGSSEYGGAYDSDAKASAVGLGLLWPFFAALYPFYGLFCLAFRASVWIADRVGGSHA